MKLPLTALDDDLPAAGPAASASSNWLAEGELQFASIPRPFRRRRKAALVLSRPPHHRYRPHRAHAARSKT